MAVPSTIGSGGKRRRPRTPCVEFTADTAILPIWIVNLALTIVTLGIIQLGPRCASAVISTPTRIDGELRVPGEPLAILKGRSSQSPDRRVLRVGYFAPCIKCLVIRRRIRPWLLVARSLSMHTTPVPQRRFASRTTRPAEGRPRVGCWCSCICIVFKHRLIRFVAETPYGTTHSKSRTSRTVHQRLRERVWARLC